VKNAEHLQPEWLPEIARPQALDLAKMVLRDNSIKLYELNAK
jgi:hypothetical protein